MTTALLYRQHEKAGRFGRQVHTAPDDGEIGDGRFDGFAARYEIDAHAVAGAIVARLLAGGTLTVSEGDDHA